MPKSLRSSRTRRLALSALALFPFGCATAVEDDPGDRGGGSGSNSGGATSTGGSAPTGGLPSNGGFKSTGGASSATGGTSSATGGAGTTGGSGTGGAATTGGAKASGGSTATGGAGTTGGANGTGGAAGGSTGGKSSTGGSSGAGGAVSGTLLSEDFEGMPPVGYPEWIIDTDGGILGGMMGGDFDDNVGNWATVVDSDDAMNHVLAQQTEYSDDSWAVAGVGTWTDQSLTVKARFGTAMNIEDTRILIAVRVAVSDTDPERGPDDPNYYYVEFRGEGSLRLRGRIDGSSEEIGDSADLGGVVEVGRWYEIGISAIGLDLEASFDGVVVLRQPAMAPGLSHGGVGLGVVDGTAEFDDLVVTTSPL